MFQHKAPLWGFIKRRLLGRVNRCCATEAPMSSNSSQAPPNGTPGPFDGPQWPYLPRNTYVGRAVLMGTVVACAPAVNRLVIMVSNRYKKLRSPLNHILVNRAVAELLVMLGAAPTASPTPTASSCSAGTRVSWRASCSP